MFSHYELSSVENEGDYDILTICRGLNIRFYDCLREVQDLVFQLADQFDLKMDDIWLIDWNFKDDVFVLQIGILND